MKDLQLVEAENVIMMMTEIQRKAVMKYAITLAYLAVSDIAAGEEINPKEYDITYLLNECGETWGNSLI